MIPISFGVIELFRMLSMKASMKPINKTSKKLLMNTTGYLKSVYVEFLNAGSCYSKVGRVFWPFPLPQSIHIGKCAHLVGHIKHEMMHTLGFYHEHSRSDRDDYIKINWENIADGRADQFLTYRWTT